ncbi:hypothetical protein EYC59_06075 [Candidatus Saccharibacteria bacterium]|nr:MAG: hypothetical protein EYC59_06075 [Candidatus Saccharibacteria bacterium]
MPLRAITTAFGSGTSGVIAMSASAEVGDIAVLTVANAAYNITSDMSLVGWTLQGSSASTSPGGELTVWTKTVTAPDIGANVTITIATATRWAAAIMVRHNVLGLDVPPVFSTSGSPTATPTAPSITTVSSGAELVSIYGISPYVSGVTATYSLPGGQTKLCDITSTSGSQRNSAIAIGEEVLGLAGASGTRQAVSATTDVGSDNRVYQGTASLAFTSAIPPTPASFTVKIRQSGVWVDKPLKARAGGVWV